MIVLPMAGLSKRFFEAGYVLPKFMLPLWGGTVFDHAVGSFSEYFSSERFLIVARHIAGHNVEGFIKQRCESLGISDLHLVMIDRETAGQAETVELGLREANDLESTLTIFNIDTFRSGFRYPDAPWFDACDGYLEVFQGEGANWSYVEPGRDGLNRVVRTTEKIPISDLCCTGLYYFSSSRDFIGAVEAERANPSARELYVAPIYNHLISVGRRIHWQTIDRSAVQFCGVPDEYERLRETPVWPRVGA